MKEDKKVDPTGKHSRRLVLGMLAGAPLASLFAAKSKAQMAGGGESLPHLTEDDPQAKALSYTDDATTANRTDKGGVAASDQFCHNCQFVQATTGEWRPCQIFPGKAVNENGWCLTWTPKADG
jgi:hypothetical protein